MRMIEGRIGAHTHEFLDADFDCGVPCIILEMRDFVVSHASLRRGVLDLGGPYTQTSQKCSRYLGAALILVVQRDQFGAERHLHGGVIGLGKE